MAEPGSRIYYAPRGDDPLFAAGSAWLGRDPVSDAADAAAGAPRDRGGHGRTARLWVSRDPEAADASGGREPIGLVCNVPYGPRRRIAPFDLPPLAVTDLHGFLALRETSFPARPLQALADACVERAGLVSRATVRGGTGAPAARRLSAEQDAMLVRWGYPYVFGTWFFHMTLTRRLSDAEKPVFCRRPEAWFASALPVRAGWRRFACSPRPRRVQPFTLAERVRLRG